MKYRVRIATLSDVGAIYGLACELLEASFQAGIPMDEVKFRKLIGTLITGKDGWVHVVVDSHDAPVGFLMGMVDELFYSRKKFATDVCMFVREEAHGMGYYLLKAFMRWSWSRTGVVEIILGVSSGMKIERIGALYEAMGFTHVGGLYIMREQTARPSLRLASSH